MPLPRAAPRSWVWPRARRPTSPPPRGYLRTRGGAYCLLRQRLRGRVWPPACRPPTRHPLRSGRQAPSGRVGYATAAAPSTRARGRAPRRRAASCRCRYKDAASCREVSCGPPRLRLRRCAAPKSGGALRALGRPCGAHRMSFRAGGDMTPSSDRGALSPADGTIPSPVPGADGARPSPFASDGTAPSPALRSARAPSPPLAGEREG